MKGTQKLRNVTERYKKADGLALKSVNLLATIGNTPYREDKEKNEEEEDDGYLDGRWAITSGFKISHESSTEPVQRSTH